MTDVQARDQSQRQAKAQIPKVFWFFFSRKNILPFTAFLVASFAGLADAATTTVVQAGQAFSQTDVTITKGDHVSFDNQDDVNHNIMVQEGDDDDDAKDMGVQPPGGKVDVPFDKAGTFKIRCHIHPSMKLTVNVK
jgi:plastocyanin